MLLLVCLVHNSPTFLDIDENGREYAVTINGLIKSLKKAFLKDLNHTNNHRQINSKTQTGKTQKL